MSFDHEAIHAAYPNELLEIVDGKGVFKVNSDLSEKFTVDQTLVDAARVELNKKLYINQWAAEYPSWQSQLDYIYHNGINKWKTNIVNPVKEKYPKPE